MSSSGVVLLGRKENLRSKLFDGLIALLLTALGLSILLSLEGRGGVHNLGLGVALIMAHGGCLLWRRSRPAAVLSVNVASGLLFLFSGFPSVALGVALLVAVYTVGAQLERRDSMLALAVTLIVMAAALALVPTRPDVSTIASNAVVLSVAWFLGDSQRSRRAYVSELEDRTSQLEAARDGLARSAVAEERLRIARELHDVVAHSMGMIAVQAGVGAHVLDERPEEAKRSLKAIEHASRSALTEIRQMLGLLRSGEDRLDMHPSPGLADLPRLVDELSEAGTELSLAVGQPAEPLPPGVELTIYRVVQEAVTNVIKHASATRARVFVGFSESEATVEVVDDGRPDSGGPSGGHGIVGMQERVALHGGKLHAAPMRDGGFRVVASIPLRGADG